MHINIETLFRNNRDRDNNTIHDRQNRWGATVSSSFRQDCYNLSGLLISAPTWLSGLESSCGLAVDRRMVGRDVPSKSDGASNSL